MPTPSAPDDHGAGREPIDGARDEDHSTGGGAAVPSQRARQATQPQAGQGDTLPRLATTRGKADGALVPVAAATMRGKKQDHAGVAPRARKMDPIDLSTFIVDSRYRTLNVVMILLASAVLVAIVAAAILVAVSRMNPESTVGLTGAGTVIFSVLALRRSARKRRQEDQEQNSDDDTGSSNA